jgi:hypothetical protein
MTIVGKGLLGVEMMAEIRETYCKMITVAFESCKGTQNVDD